MRLTEALAIAEITIDFFAESNRRPVIRLSNVGATSVKTLVQAMLLSEADQYQLEIATGKTAADFNQRAGSYGHLIATLVFGGCLPDEVYDRIVKENPDPQELNRALIAAGHESDRGDAFETETGESFYKFLTSLDPRSPTYWPAVYDRLGLPFHSDTVPAYRINLDPGGAEAGTGRSRMRRGDRGMSWSFLFWPRYRVNLNPKGREAFRVFVEDTYTEMRKLFLAGASQQLSARDSLDFNLRFGEIMHIRDGLNRIPANDASDYTLKLPGRKLAPLAYQLSCYCATQAAAAHLSSEPAKVDLDKLAAALGEMIDNGPQTGPFCIKKMMERGFDYVEQKLKNRAPESPEPPKPASTPAGDAKTFFDSR
jgi:hypothetical protein